MPAGAVYVGRPTKWGNPYRIKRHGGFHVVWCEPEPGVSEFLMYAPRDECIEFAVRKFRDALHGGLLAVTGEDVRRELRGQDLACWCPPGAVCHADVLLEVANESPRD